jgi:glucan 1,3-beta-glucosidase
LIGKYSKYNQPGFPSGSKLRKRDTYYWLEDYASRYPGTYPFGDDSSYVVYRNVMDYGAAGDGVADDTDAINAAIADGDRCGDGCGSSSVKGALIYFPSGVLPCLLSWKFNIC